MMYTCMHLHLHLTFYIKKEVILNYKGFRKIKDQYPDRVKNYESIKLLGEIMVKIKI